MGLEPGLLFDGRVAVVTGGSKGIGRACVQRLAQEGATVLFTHRLRDQSVDDMLGWAATGGGKVFAVQADASDPASWSIVHAALDTHAEGRLDVLVNNVGDAIRRTRFDQSDIALWKQSFDLNVLSAVAATLELLPLLKQSPAGVVVNMSSIAGSTTGAGDSLHYGTAKAALDTFTVGLAREMKGTPVRVVGIAPGIIDTEFHERHSSAERMQSLLGQTPAGRAGRAEEVADLVAWLASDRSGYVSGTVVKISGGR